MADLVIRRGDMDFDHVVLATRNTREAADWFFDQSGVQPIITEPEPGQWYRSASVPLTQGSFIELLGPAPKHRSFHPIKQLLARYDVPRPLFWHLAAGEFDAFCEAVRQAGARPERIEHLDSDTPDGRRTYSRGIGGPGFRSVRPCFIHWKSRPERAAAKSPQCTATRFTLQDPEPEPLNRLFKGLGLSLRATEGPSSMALEIATPKGPLSLHGPGTIFEGAGALLKTARLYFDYLRSLRKKGGVKQTACWPTALIVVCRLDWESERGPAGCLAQARRRLATTPTRRMADAINGNAAGIGTAAKDGATLGLPRNAAFRVLKDSASAPAPPAEAESAMTR